LKEVFLKTLNLLGNRGKILCRK